MPKPNVSELGLLAIQAARMYLEFAEIQHTMTEAEATEKFRAVGRRVSDANQLWEQAGNQNAGGS